MSLKPNEAIILTIFLIAAFVMFFAWFLSRACLRAVDAEVHELVQQGLGRRKEGDGEAQTQAQTQHK